MRWRFQVADALQGVANFTHDGNKTGLRVEYLDQPLTRREGTRPDESFYRGDFLNYLRNHSVYAPRDAVFSPSCAGNQHQIMIQAAVCVIERAPTDARREP